MTKHTITKRLNAAELRDLIQQSIASADEQTLCDMADILLEAEVSKTKGKDQPYDDLEFEDI